MIAAGTYVARAIEGSAASFVTNGGYDQISFEAELTDIGETVRIYLTITDTTKNWVWRKLAAAGWDGEDLDSLDGLGSKEFQVQVKHEEWKGKRVQRCDVLLHRNVSKNLSEKYGREAKAAVRNAAEPLF